MDNTAANFFLGFAQVSGFLAALAGGVLRTGSAQSGPWLSFLRREESQYFSRHLKRSVAPHCSLIQPVLTGAFFPGAFSALSQDCPSHLRSVVASAAVPIAFFMGAAFFPAFFGYLGQNYSSVWGLSWQGRLCSWVPSLLLRYALVETDQEGC